jgi:hypothetical protein
MSDDILRRLAPQVRNWGKWGPDDEVGTLNDITPDAIAAAARLAGPGGPAGWPLPNLGRGVRAALG